MARAMRWTTGAYLAVMGVGVGAGWFSNSLPALRVSLTVVYIGVAGWFLQWRSEQKRRQQAEAELERGARKGQPCGICLHYACDGQTCLTCDNGTCTPVGLTRPVEHSYWLN